MLKRIGFTVIAFLAFSVVAPAADLFSGTWVLNIAKSSHSQNKLEQSATQTISREGQWWILRAHSLDSAGNTTAENRMFTLDGKTYPTVGASGGGTLTTETKLDDFRLTVTRVAITGKAHSVNNLVISSDGRSRTNTVVGVDAEGLPFQILRVYDKQ